MEITLPFTEQELDAINDAAELEGVTPDELVQRALKKITTEIHDRNNS